MKPQHFAVAASLLLLVALALIFTAKPPQNPVPTVDTATDQLVTVIGEAEVKAKPDLATINLGVRVHGDSAYEAESLLLAFAANIKNAMVSAGVDGDLVEISRPELQPDTHQDYSGATQIAGYTAQARVVGTLKNLGKVQAVIDSGLIAGATSVESVTYAVSNPESARQSAISKALDNARARAGVLAKNAGGSISLLKSAEVLPDDAPPQASASGVIFKVRVKATFAYS